MQQFVGSLATKRLSLKWRRDGRHNLIRELHAQKLTVQEIKDHLAARKTSTGQVVKFTAGRIYMMLRKMALRPNRYSTGYLSALQKAAEFHLQGESFEWIAKQLNKEGLLSGSGKPWTSRSFTSVRCIQARAAIASAKDYEGHELGNGGFAFECCHCNFYLITLSVFARTLFGIVKPIGLAVFKLMNSSDSSTVLLADWLAWLPLEFCPRRWLRAGRYPRSRRRRT